MQTPDGGIKVSTYIRTCIHTYICTTHTYSRRQIKVPGLYSQNSGSALSNVITEDTLEPCHLHLVLSTSPTILFFV